MSTRIDIIHGLSKESGRRFDHSKTQYVPINNLTSGEFRLHLLYKELDAVRQLYPEFKDSIQFAQGMIQDAIFYNLHGDGQRITQNRGYLDHYGTLVANAISENKGRVSSVQRGGFIDRPNTTAIGDLIIPQRNCSVPPPMPAGWSGSPFSDLPATAQWYQAWNSSGNPNGRLKCEQQKKLEEAANKHLEKASPHTLYEFIGNANLYPPIVANKAGYHQAALSGFSNVGEWKRDDMREWFRTGVKLSSMANGLPAEATPEDCIEVLRLNKNQPGIKGVGVLPFSVLAPLLTKLISALASAIAAMAVLVGAFKGISPDKTISQLQRLQDLGLGLENFSPDTKDFLGGDDTSDGPETGGSNNNGGGGTDPKDDKSSDGLMKVALVGMGLYFVTKK